MPNPDRYTYGCRHQLGRWIADRPDELQSRLFDDAQAWPRSPPATSNGSPPPVLMTRRSFATSSGPRSRLTVRIRRTRAGGRPASRSGMRWLEQGAGGTAGGVLVEERGESMRCPPAAARQQRSAAPTDGVRDAFVTKCLLTAAGGPGGLDPQRIVDLTTQLAAHHHVANDASTTSINANHGGHIPGRRQRLSRGLASPSARRSRPETRLAGPPGALARPILSRSALLAASLKAAGAVFLGESHSFLGRRRVTYGLSSLTDTETDSDHFR